MEYTFDKISDLVIETNNQFLIAAKPPGMPSVPDKTNDKSLKSILEAYAKKDLYVITRLDRPVGGLMVFAKSNNAATALTEQIKKRTFKKSYLAVVEGHPDKEKLSLKHFHIKKGNKAKIFDKASEESKEIQLNYDTRKKLDRYTILDVDLITGRFHQIRAQLSHIGFPVKGDVKYGARRGNKDRSVDLISYKIEFVHPTSHKKVDYTADLAKYGGLWKFA